MKKILFVSMDDYPHIGGKSTHMSSLISGLEYYGYSCDVIARNCLSDTKIKMYKFLKIFNKFFNKGKYLYLRKKIEYNLMYKKLKKIDFSEYDAISCQDALSATLVGKIDSKLNISLTMHTYFGLEYLLDNDVFDENNKYYLKLLKMELDSLNFTKKVVAVDERIFNHVSDIIKERNLKNVKVFTISNFTNTDMFMPNKKISSNKFHIGCIRRIVEKNGTIYAVKAMENLKKYNNIVLDIYGDGPCFADLKKEIEEKNLNNVILHGAIANELLPKVYNQLNLILVPSITVNGLQEATSISVIEAMSSGIPVIASNIGGIKLLIENDKTGLLVKEKDEKEISEAILKIYNNQKLSEYISKNARNYILKNHSHIAVAKEYLKIFLNR